MVERAKKKTFSFSFCEREKNGSIREKYIYKRVPFESDRQVVMFTFDHEVETRGSHKFQRARSDTDQGIL